MSISLGGYKPSPTPCRVVGQESAGAREGEVLQTEADEEVTGMGGKGDAKVFSVRLLNA